MTMLAYPIQSEYVTDLGMEGKDLTQYTNELTNVRKTRCLNLRTSINLCPNKSCKWDGKFYVCPKRSSSLNSLSTLISSEQIIETLQQNISSESSQNIQSLCTNIGIMAEQSPKTVDLLIANQDVQDAFVTFLDENSNVLSTKIIIDMITEISRTFTQQTIEDFIDIGLSSQIMFLLSNDEEEIVRSSIHLTGVLCSLSGYARDAIICLGIHTILIDFASNNRGTEIAVLACKALKEIYGNQSDMDTQVIRDSTRPIVELIEGQTEETIYDIYIFISVDLHQ